MKRALARKMNIALARKGTECIPKGDEQETQTSECCLVARGFSRTAIYCPAGHLRQVLAEHQDHVAWKPLFTTVKRQI